MNIQMKRGLAATTAIALGLGFSTVGASAAFAGVTSSYTFKVDTLASTNGIAEDTVSTAGDDGGFVAVTPDVVIRDGDDATYTYNLNSLGDIGPTDISSTNDEIFTDLGTETAYVLVLNGDDEFDSATALDADGNLTSTTITFSEVIPTENGDNWAAASGAGQFAFWNYTTGDLYVVSIPSGKVSIVATSTLDAFTGVQPYVDNGETDSSLDFQSVLEYDCTGYSIVTLDTDYGFSRFNLADASVEELLAGSNYIDTDNLVVSPSADRWYFHAENDGEGADFGINVDGMSEQLVSADATSTVTADVCKDADPELPNTGVDAAQSMILAGGAAVVAIAGVALLVIRRRNA